MTSLIKFELGKILRNRTVFGGIVVGCLVLLGIFFVGYHYSQLSMSEASNKKKGFEKSLDVIIDEKYSGCLLYTSPSPRDRQKSRMPSSA